MKKQKGITLIALIITIIVLLILAGVSISIIIGDNGVIKQAQTAKDKTDLVNAQSAVEMAVTALQTEYMLEKNKNVNAEIANTFIVENLNRELKRLGYELRGLNNFENTDSIFKTEKGDMSKFSTQLKSTKVSDNNIYDVIITRKNKNSVVVGKEVTIATVEKNSYNLPGIDKIGETYDYLNKINGIDLECTWKVFWSDENGIYIIITDYLPVAILNEGEQSISSKTGLSTIGKYRANWPNIPQKFQHINNIVLSKYCSKYSFSVNFNSKDVSSLLNSENWEDFVDKSKGATFAIGGVPLEMWIESWNEKTKNDANRAELSCQGRGTGYDLKIKLKTGDVTDVDDSDYDFHLNGTNISLTDEYNIQESDNLYFPHKGNQRWNGCDGYWLASPSSWAGARISYVHYSGAISGRDSCDENILALRPVVFIQ